MRLREIYLMLSIGFFFRVCVAIWNGFWGPSFGAEQDARSFHRAATTLLQEHPFEKLKTISLVHPDFHPGAHLWSEFYTKLLSTLYSITTNSLFIGSLASAIFWMGSAIILIKILQSLSAEKSSQFTAVLIYALLPSSILYTSVTMRESFQLFFVNLMVYSAIKFYSNKSIMHCLILIGSIIVLKNLHIALFVLGLFVVFATLLLFAIRGRKNLSIFIIILTIPAVFIIGYYLLSRFGVSYLNNNGYAAGNDLISKVENFNLVVISSNARTQYKDGVDLNGITDLLFFILTSFLQYLFEPMPWRSTSTMDKGSILENILRAWLIWKALTGIGSIPTPKRRLALFTFSSFLVLEGVWSIGTINWGTALRHHVPGMGLLLASAFAYSKKISNSKIYLKQSQNMVPEANPQITNNLNPRELR